MSLKLDNECNASTRNSEHGMNKLISNDLLLDSLISRQSLEKFSYFRTALESLPPCIRFDRSRQTAAGLYTLIVVRVII